MHAYYLHSHGKFIPAQFDLSFFLWVFPHQLYEQEANNKVSGQNGMGLKFSSRSVDITAPKCLQSFFFLLYILVKT